ncbi:hypothetical protein QZH46_27170 [Pseudomonas corrugata]
MSKTPLKQCFAITGSINQFGEVQAVGGVNEKIEGFFRLCEARGLTGEQGAIIPQANVATLMLDEKVLAAVRAGQFHVYAVRQADEALSLLVGEPAGEPDENGEFPEGSVNARVVERLRVIAEMISEDDIRRRRRNWRKQPWRRPSRLDSHRIGDPCGSGLAREGGMSVTVMSTGIPSSRASLLPQ